MSKLTKPQHAALKQIEQHGGIMRLSWIVGRMVDCHRVANALEAKGLVTRTNAGRDSGTYLHITDAGRAALSKAVRS